MKKLFQFMLVAVSALAISSCTTVKENDVFEEKQNVSISVIAKADDLASDDIETIEATIVGDIQEYLDENVLPRISTIEDEIDDLDGRITNVTENIIPPISNAVSELDRRMDAVEETLADINPEALEEAIAEIREAVDTIEEYDERLDDIQADIGTIKNDITGIKNEDELQDAKLENHEERIQALEEGGGGGISPDDIFVIYGGDATHVLIDAHQAGGNNG